MANITIPTQGNPTPPSRKGWVGAAWGYLAGIIPASVVSGGVFLRDLFKKENISRLEGLDTYEQVAKEMRPVATKAYLASAAIVAATTGIGYLWGKSSGDKRKAEELSAGKKEVREPSIWNSGLAKGFISAMGLGIGAQGISLLASGNVITSTFAAFGLLGAELALVIGGSIAGKNRMRREYAQAKQIEAQSRQQEIVQAVQLAQSKSAAIEPAPETTSLRTDKSEPKPELGEFTKAVNERNAASAGQENTIG